MRHGRPSTVAALVTVAILAGIGVAGPAAGLEVGQKAPDFTLPAPGGKPVKLSDLTAKGPVVLDRSGDVTGRVYGVWGPPTLYLIDRKGQLVGRATGPRDWTGPAARQLLLALLDAKP